MDDDAHGPIWKNGEAYENFMGQWSRAVGKTFLEWLRPPNDARWLEVGCGTGAFTQVILDHGAPGEVVGIDPAEAQLAFAEQKVSGANIVFRCGDALELPFADHDFDIAVSALVLNFVPDQEKMVSEMTRVVRPSGEVALYVWDFADRKPVAQHIAAAIAARDSEAAKRAASGQQFQTTSPEYLRRLFEDGGLVDTETRTIEIDVRFRDFDDYWSANTEFASPVGQYVSGLSADDREKFIAEVKRLLPLSADGSIEYVARANAVRGIVPA
jgi:ubiquinone/menaquinone biosynthesis C-methylase UbiE